MRGTGILVIGLLAGCGSKGAVMFTVREPVYGPLNPISDSVTEYSIKRLDGTLVAVASQSPMSPDRLPLGPLSTWNDPVDLQVSVLSGSNLLGLARLKDVTVQPAVQREYAVEVRKPLITIGSALPLMGEVLAGATTKPGQILDPIDGKDLSLDAAGPHLPARTSAVSATWDGRFLLAAADKTLSVIDTGSGERIGGTTLPFAATRVVVGARDSAAAVIDTAGVSFYRDVAGLTANPAEAIGMRVALPGVAVRTATFGPDGKSLFVLGGGEFDPCSPTAKVPAPNSLMVLGIDGTMLGTWTFSGYVADIAIDGSGGKVLVADVSGNRVATFDAKSPFGAVAPVKLVDATCPTAVRTAAGDVVVVTNEKDTRVKPADFVVQRVSLRTGVATKLPLNSPLYDNIPLPDTPTPSGNTKLGFQFTPASLVAYEMAITPDATRAVFATRARYHEMNSSLTVFLNPCKATYDVVEYGVYELDLRTGQATYTLRSQLVVGTGGRTDCIICNVGLGTLPFSCESTPGDRAAGISTVFGGF